MATRRTAPRTPRPVLAPATPPVPVSRPVTPPVTPPVTRPVTRPVTEADEPEVTLTRSHPTLRRMAARIVELEQAAGKDSAEARVEIGGILAEVRDRLPHGEWLAWLAAEVPYRERSARYYISLHRWARDNPDLFARTAPLGVARLYYLTRLDRPALDKLLGQKLVTIPGSGERVALQQASPQQLGRLLAPPPSLLTPESLKALASYQRRVKGVIKATKALATHRRALPREDLHALRDELREAADRLTKLFKLEP